MEGGPASKELLARLNKDRDTPLTRRDLRRAAALAQLELDRGRYEASKADHGYSREIAIKKSRDRAGEVIRKELGLDQDRGLTVSYSEGLGANPERDDRGYYQPQEGGGGRISLGPLAFDSGKVAVGVVVHEAVHRLQDLTNNYAAEGAPPSATSVQEVQASRAVLELAEGIGLSTEEKKVFETDVAQELEVIKEEENETYLRDLLKDPPDYKLAPNHRP